MSKHRVQPEPPPRDPDLRHAEAALQRAAKRAQRQIRAAGFKPVVQRPEPPPRVNKKQQKHTTGILEPLTLPSPTRGEGKKR
ncbi:MAG: hypothetical protein HQL58_10760 [Magnetococcales bacterium]|nr:hypothetical protein [Magnetococcales bacterium]